METDDATVAALFRAGLSLGIATPADLVPWADEQVLARERPAEWIMDLSLGRAVPASEVSERLRDVVWNVDPNRVFRLIVGLVDRPQWWSHEAAHRAADWMWCVAHNHAKDPNVAWAAAALADELWLAANDFADDPRTPAVRERSIAAVDTMIGTHADPTARAWLPGVRVTFA
jgi:hypothetical protein